MLPQHLCGKHDISHNFQDEKYFKKKNWNVVALAQLTKYSRDILHTQIGKKLENILNELLKKLAVYVLHQIDVPMSDYWRILQHTFQCFWTKKNEAGRMNSFRKGHMTCRMLSIKRDCFLVCFVQNITYLVGMSDVTTISNDQGNILQNRCYNNIKQSGKYSTDFMQNFTEKNMSIAV